jgi:Bacteroidetes VLRF1 release factor
MYDTKQGTIGGVCRAKAGGRQATQDATGRFAKSAGSQIRRHNEVGMLDIANLDRLQASQI